MPDSDRTAGDAPIRDDDTSTRDSDATSRDSDASTSDGDAPTHHSDASSGHYVYVLACADDSLYTGYTTDVERRVREHDSGEGAKYTRGRTPVDLVHTEDFDSRSAAMSREYEIKQLSRADKERLVGLDG